MPYIDTEQLSKDMRSKGVDISTQKVLVTCFDNSLQKSDLGLPPNCDGYGRLHHFKRDHGSSWPQNPLPIDPALHWLGQSIIDQLQVQLFQIAVCNWSCWYCFVDYKLKCGHPDSSAFKSVPELLDLYSAESQSPSVIVLSGGQPDLVPEWTVWFADELLARNLQQSTYLWSDDNLSNDFLWRYLSPSEISRLSSCPNYGRVGCFKGFDSYSFSFNTQVDPSEFDKQFKLIKRLVIQEFDVYGYVTFTSDRDDNVASAVTNFIDRLQTEVHPLFPLRTVPLRIREWGPTKVRMNEAYSKALHVQFDVAEAWMDEINHRFPKEMRKKQIFEHSIRG